MDNHSLPWEWKQHNRGQATDCQDRPNYYLNIMNRMDKWYHKAPTYFDSDMCKKKIHEHDKAHNPNHRMYTATLHQTPLPRYEIHGHPPPNTSPEVWNTWPPSTKHLSRGMKYMATRPDQIQLHHRHSTQTLQSWINTAHLGNRMTDSRLQNDKRPHYQQNRSEQWHRKNTEHLISLHFSWKQHISNESDSLLLHPHPPPPPPPVLFTLVACC